MSTLLRVISPPSSTSSSTKGKVTFISVYPQTTVREACQEALKAFGLLFSSTFTLVIESGRTRIYNPYYEQNSSNCNSNTLLSAPIACIETGQLSMPLDPSWRLLPYLNSNGNNNDLDSSSSSRTPTTSLPPWSVVAYLVQDLDATIVQQEDDAATATNNSNRNQKPMMFRKFSQVNRIAVPKVPDGRIIEDIILKERREATKEGIKLKNSETKEKEASEDVVVASLIGKITTEENETTKKSNHNNKKNIYDQEEEDHENDERSMLTMESLLPKRLQNLTNSLKPCAYTE